MSTTEWRVIDVQRAKAPEAAPVLLALSSFAFGYPVIVDNPQVGAAPLQKFVNSEGSSSIVDLLSPLLRYRDEGFQRARLAIDDLIVPLENGPELAARLRELLEFAKDEYPETGIPTYTSIAALHRFLLECAGIVAPALALLPSGSIWLSWRSQRFDAGLSIFRDGTASFGLLLAGAARPTHVNFAGSLDEVISRMLNEQGIRSLFS